MFLKGIPGDSHVQTMLRNAGWQYIQWLFIKSEMVLFKCVCVGGGGGGAHYVNSTQR